MPDYQIIAFLCALGRKNWFMRASRLLLGDDFYFCAADLWQLGLSKKSLRPATREGLEKLRDLLARCVVVLTSILVDEETQENA